MAGVGIIANPHSKLNRRNPRRQQLLSYIAGEQGHFKLTNDLNELNRVAAEFRGRGISILAVNGGDGTISRTLSSFTMAYGDKPLPSVALLRGGTMNMLADNLGIKGTPEHNLFSLLERHSSGAPLKKVRIRTLRINSDYGFLFASGTSARFLEEFYKNKTGAAGSFLLMSKIACSYLFKGNLFKRIIRNEPLTLTLSGDQTLEHGSLSVFASTVERLPLGARLFPEAAKKRSEIQIVSITLQENELVGNLVQHFFLNPDKPGKGKLRLSTPKFSIKSDSPLVYTLDGEIYHSEDGNLSISLGPGIDFLIPD